jgi:hypothetical protein
MFLVQIEPNSECGELVECHHEVFQVASESVESPHHQGVEAAASRIRHLFDDSGFLLQCRKPALSTWMGWHWANTASMESKGIEN